MTHAATLAKAASAIGNASVSSTYPSFSIGKNAIINGAFDIWQRGTSFAAIASGAYNTDRWMWVNTSAAAHTVSRSTDVPTAAEAGVLANYSALLDCTTADASVAAGDVVSFQQRIEGYVWRNFAQRALTLSFWVKATKTGTYCVSLANTGPDRSYIAEYTVSSADTWEKKTLNIPASPSAGTWDYTTGTGMQVRFALVCGSTYQTTAGSWATGDYYASSNQVNAADSTSNNFRLALVQLEVGDVATDFEIRSYPVELRMCERYYFLVPSTSVALNSANNKWTVGTWWTHFTRATPTYGIISGGGKLLHSGSAFYDISTIDVANELYIDFTASGYPGANLPGFLLTGGISATSEL